MRSGFTAAQVVTVQHRKLGMMKVNQSIRLSLFAQEQGKRDEMTLTSLLSLLDKEPIVFPAVRTLRHVYCRSTNAIRSRKERYGIL